mgnify:CR=1 FL=1
MVICIKKRILADNPYVAGSLFDVDANIYSLYENDAELPCLILKYELSTLFRVVGKMDAGFFEFLECNICQTAFSQSDRQDILILALLRIFPGFYENIHIQSESHRRNISSEFFHELIIASAAAHDDSRFFQIDLKDHSGIILQFIYETHVDRDAFRVLDQTADLADIFDRRLHHIVESQRLRPFENPLRRTVKKRQG